MLSTTRLQIIFTIFWVGLQYGAIHLQGTHARLCSTTYQGVSHLTPLTDRKAKAMTVRGGGIDRQGNLRRAETFAGSRSANSASPARRCFLSTEQSTRGPGSSICLWTHGWGPPGAARGRQGPRALLGLPQCKHCEARRDAWRRLNRFTSIFY